MDSPTTPMVDSNLGGLLLALLWSLAGVSACIVGLRLYAGAFILHRLKLPDYLMIIAFICAIIQTSFITPSVHWGLGRHTNFLSSDEISAAMKYVIMCQGWGVASASFGRISFCLYLYQFVGSSQVRRAFIYFFVGTQALINALTIIQFYTRCGSHVDALWIYNLDVKCSNPNVVRVIGFVESAWNSLTDFFLTILPATIVWKLNLDRLQKLGIVMLLSLSIFAFIESVIKCYQVKEIGLGVDITWHIAVYHLWAVSEDYIVIIGASVPTISCLWKRGKRSASEQLSYEMYGQNSGVRTISRVGVRSMPNTQNTVAKSNSIRIPGYSSTSQEHILEPQKFDIVRTVVVDVSYSNDTSRLDTA